MNLVHKIFCYLSAFIVGPTESPAEDVGDTDKTTEEVGDTDKTTEEVGGTDKTTEEVGGTDNTVDEAGGEDYAAQVPTTQERKDDISKEKKNKEFSILDMHGLLKSIVKYPKDTFIPIKAKDVQIMDQEKLEQFVQNKMVQITRKKSAGEHTVNKDEMKKGKQNKSSTQIMTKDQLKEFEKARKVYKFIHIPHNDSVRIVNKKGKIKFIQYESKADIIDISNMKHGITKDRRKSIKPEVVDNMTRKQLVKVKKTNPMDNFIGAAEELLKSMNCRDLESSNKDKKEGTKSNGKTKGSKNHKLCERILPIIFELKMKVIERSA